MVEGVLLGLLFCKTNDAVNMFLLPAIVYSKEGREEERLGWLVDWGSKWDCREFFGLSGRWRLG